MDIHGWYDMNGSDMNVKAKGTTKRRRRRRRRKGRKKTLID